MAQKFSEEYLRELIVKLWDGPRNPCPECGEPLHTDFHKDDCPIPELVPSQHNKEWCRKRLGIQ